MSVSAFYTSNVEYYLLEDGSFDRFADNVAALPFDEGSVIIRSFFGRNFGFVHPQSVPGYYSVQLLQGMEVPLNPAWIRYNWLCCFTWYVYLHILVALCSAHKDQVIPCFRGVH